VPSEQTPAAGRPALAAQSVNKRFKIPEERSHTLKERALHPLRRTRHERLQALKDITFSVAPGEFFGIVGRNGSGKSTLLKCLAGIYRTDSGRIWADGRISTFIELGVGFNPDLAAYDNVALNGVMLGLSSREARARYKRVIEFAELEEFQELKLKNYSSGMHVRLAFSVAIQVDADILLIDEVLAVGDAAFQQKCFDVFNRMREEGRTIVFVTHDMSAVTRFCHRAMLLERGEILALGDPEDVADRYLEISFGRQVGYEDPDVGSARMGDGAARVSEVWLGESPDEGRAVAPQSEPLTIKALVGFHAEVTDPAVSLTLLNEQRQPVVVATTTEEDERTGGFRPGEWAVFAFSLHNMLAPGRYHTILTITRRGEGVDVIDRLTGGLTFVVTGTAASGGMVEIPVEIETTRWRGPDATTDVASAPTAGGAS
jgi:ABC-type polysaccharide/polyol phosphate transport system ATPase subunit